VHAAHEVVQPFFCSQKPVVALIRGPNINECSSCVLCFGFGLRVKSKQQQPFGGLWL
jgi:hypothetical protein